MSHLRDPGKNDKTVSFYEVQVSQSKENLLNRSFFSKTTIDDHGFAQMDEREDWSPIHDISGTSFACDSQYIKITNIDDLNDIVRQLDGDFSTTHIKPILPKGQQSPTFDIIFSKLRQLAFNIPLELAAENKEFIVQIISSLTKDYLKNLK